jgi:hypothetical protein
VFGLAIASRDARGVGETVGDPTGAAADVTTARKTANPNEQIPRIFEGLLNYNTT